MTLSKLNTDLNIVQSLDNQPNAVTGLTPEVVKAKFDEAGNEIKEYINDTLTVELDTLDSANVKKTGNQTIQGIKTFGSSPIVPAPTSDMQTSTKKYVDDKDTTRKTYIDTNFTTKDEISTDRKLSATGDFTGTINGLQPIEVDPFISTQVAENTSQLAQNVSLGYENTNITTMKQRFEEILINVKDFGAKGDGITDNTIAIQSAMDSLKNGETLYFPEGTYLTNTILFKDSTAKRFKIKGSNYKHHSTIGDSNSLIGGTQIVYIGSAGGKLFERETGSGFVVEFEELIFSACSSINDATYQTCYFMFYNASGSSNTRYITVYAKNCKWFGWLTAFGEYREIDNGGVNDLATNIGQCNVKFEKCSFTRNKHAISQCIDSVILNSQFSINDYAIVLRKYGFANRMIGNRIEWNIKNGIYIYQGESIITSNEFDRSGYAGLHIVKSKSSIVSNNKFLRNGAYENSSGTGGATNLVSTVQDVHIYADNNINCIFSNNVCREERQWDSGTGDVVPYRCSTFTNNSNCVIEGNSLDGGNIKYTNYKRLNLFKNNSYCIISNVLYSKENQVGSKNYSQDIIINASEQSFISLGLVDQVTSSILEIPKKIIVTCILNNGSITSANVQIWEIPVMLFFSGDNNGIILGTSRKLMGNEDIPPFSIPSKYYYISDNVIGITLKNTTATNNRYLLRLEQI